MKSPHASYFDIDRRLTLTLFLLIVLILVGNGLVILQFEKARLQTDRLTGVSQQLIAVLRLQEGLLLFHQRLSELAQSKDAKRLASESIPLRREILERAQRTRNTLAYLPSDSVLDPAFVTALDAFATNLPSQLQDINGLAAADDWQAVRLRLDNESSRMETTTASLVENINRNLDEELPRAVKNMRDVQRRIFIVVPATALSTALIAVFLGWAIARRILELRLEERVNERTRIARELHDTLLQSFQGVLMNFSSVSYQIRDHPAEAHEALERVIVQARRAIIEGRDAVQGLRSSTFAPGDLSLSIKELGEELTLDTHEHPPEFRVHVEGTPRDLVSLVSDEVHRIAGEALRNAFQHAHARWIKAEIVYDPRHLRLRIADDGKGIDERILSRGALSGHFGLAGLHERARLIGGKLAIRSKLDSGTEIELTVPASVAYRKQPGVAASGRG